MSPPTSAQHLNTFDISIQFKKKYNVPIISYIVVSHLNMNILFV